MRHPATALKEASAKATAQSFAALGFGVYQGYQSVYVWPLGSKELAQNFKSVEQARAYAGVK